jgi:hypothetical protein
MLCNSISALTSCSILSPSMRVSAGRGSGNFGGVSKACEFTLAVSPSSCLYIVFTTTNSCAMLSAFFLFAAASSKKNINIIIYQAFKVFHKDTYLLCVVIIIRIGKEILT